MLRFFILIAAALIYSHSIIAQMVLNYKTTVPNTNIVLPLNGTVDVTVDWGDGSAKQKFTSATAQKHIYQAVGSFKVTISGKLSRFGNDKIELGANLKSVESWDILGLKSLSFAFRQATALTFVPAYLPDSVTDLSYMFSGASSFNQNINIWNTVHITNLRGMFYEASSFNQPIGTWNTERVEDMATMFYQATSFNQPIGTWNTAKVINMAGMFDEAKLFNQPIGFWNTGNVTDMSYMFFGASSFNQPIGTWNIANVQDMRSMLEGGSLCTINYDNLLNGWAPQAVKSSASIYSPSSKYSPTSVAARAILIKKGWSITDGGQGINNTKCPEITGLEDLDKNSLIEELEIYPNPSAGLIIVSNKNILGTISIYNSLGTLVYEAKTEENQHSLNLATLQSGIYIVKTSSKSGKLVIE